MSFTLHARPAAAAGDSETTNATQAVVASDLRLKERTHGWVNFVTGGSGLREAIAMKRAMHQYPLALEFRVKANGKMRFLGGVPVTVKVPAGPIVLEAVSAGPFLFARLSPGRYEVMAGWRGKRQRQEVDVGVTGSEHVVFQWDIA